MKWVITMKYIYQVKNNIPQPRKNILKNFWVHLNNPSEEEMKSVCASLDIEAKVLRKALDRSETPHMEIEPNYVLFIIKIPYVILNKEKKKYRALPMAIFVFNNGILTVTTSHHPIITDLKKVRIHGLRFLHRRSFPIFLINKTIEYYIRYLNEIQEDILSKEKTLIKSTSNKDLEHMLTLQKSLLYFTTALQGNRSVLEKIENNCNLLSEEQDLLVDVQIEIKQAIEMANTYREILENTMDTYSSIISNNLNDIMKFLTSITLVISIPTMISSFLGMNLSLGSFGTNPFSFVLIVSLSFFIAIVLVILLKKKNLL